MNGSTFIKNTAFNTLLFMLITLAANGQENDIVAEGTVPQKAGTG